MHNTPRAYSAETQSLFVSINLNETYGIPIKDLYILLSQNVLVSELYAGIYKCTFY